MRPDGDFVPRAYTEPTRTLTAQEFDVLRSKYDLNVTQSVRYSDTTCRYLLPICGPDGDLRGHIARDATGQNTPKTLTYKAVDAPFLHWSPFDNATAHLVLVEDWFSAEKVGQVDGCRGISLNGTHLSPDGKMEIAHHAENMTVHVALDGDAFSKGLKLAYDLGIALQRQAFTWKLGKDLKYVGHSIIERAIRERKFDLSGDYPTQDVL